MSNEPKIKPYTGPAGGWGSVRSVESILAKEGRLISGNALLLKRNKVLRSTSRRRVPKLSRSKTPPPVFTARMVLPSLQAPIFCQSRGSWRRSPKRRCR